MMEKSTFETVCYKKLSWVLRSHFNNTFSRKHNVLSPPNWLKEMSTTIFCTRHFTSLTCRKRTTKIWTSG